MTHLNESLADARNHLIKYLHNAFIINALGCSKSQIQSLITKNKHNPTIKFQQLESVSIKNVYRSVKSI